MRKIIYFVLLSFILYTNVFCQEIRIKSVKAEDFPIMSAQFVAIDANGQRTIPSLDQIKFFERNVPRNITSIRCPENYNKVKPASIVITLDNSGSMGSTVTAEQNMEIAKKAANNLILQIPNNSVKVEVALTSFDNGSALRQDFTNDKVLLTNAVNSISPNGGTNYFSGLLGLPSGSLQISKNAKFPKTIIFLTDGYSTLNDEQAIIDEANKQNCRIYIVCLGIDIPKELRNIAIATNGKFFDRVTKSEIAESIFSEIFDEAQGMEPCTFEWISELDCEKQKVSIELNWNKSKSFSEYYQPSDIKSNFSYNPKSIFFKFNGINTKVDASFTITSKNSFPVNISDIVSSNPKFTISPTSITLLPGETKKLDITYTPTDSSYNFTTFSIISDICEFSYFASGGYKHIRNLQSPLTIVKPNGGETFVAGIDTIIRWKNISPKDTVSLYYSINNGKKWNLITNKASGLEYQWNVASYTTDSCLIKVELGNKTHKKVDSNNISYYNPTAYTESATWSNDGSKIYFGNYDSYQTYALKELDLNTGSIKKLLNVQANYLYIDKIARNPIGNQLAIGDSSMFIIDLNTNSVEVKLETPFVNFFIIDLEWSPDGTKIAAIYEKRGTGLSNLKILVVYDYVNKIVFDKIELIPWIRQEESSISWSPNSELIAISGFNSLIEVYNTKNKSIIKEIEPNSEYSFSHVQWFNDNMHIMGVDKSSNKVPWNKSNPIYNTSTLSQVNEFINPYYSFCLSYNPNENIIAIDSLQYVQILDANTLTLIRTFTVLRNSITAQNVNNRSDRFNHLEISPSGKQVLGILNYNSQPLEKAMFVWEIDDTNSQVDISDSVFRIVVPEFKTQAIDMGKVIVGSSKDSVITPFIENTSEAPFAVNTIRIIGQDASAFSLVSGTPVYTISAFSSSFGEFQFVPNRVGIHNAFVEMITQADSVVIPIQGEGIEDAIAQASKIIDFGTIDIFTRKDSLNVTTISAVSATPIQVTNARIEGGSASSFSILSPFAGNATITSIDTLKLDLQFFAQSVGRVQSQLILDHTGIGSPARITLFGNGRDTAIGNLRIVAPELTAKTTTSLTIPIYLENVDNVTFSSNAVVDFNLRFNSTILTPRTTNSPSTIVNGEQSVPLSFPLLPDSNGVIGTIDVRVGLGNASSTPLSIDSVRVRNSPERIGKRDGLVTIIDICEEGGTRLVNSSTKVGLALMSAVPVSQQIELKLTSVEIGVTTIQLYDTEGKMVSELWNGTPVIGDTYLTVQALNFPNGTYFLILKTPTVQETIPFIIQR